ncbi:ISL3 family transposase [Staphylococcus sp. SQ8-PEA]|uniref:ISL3 family transposase n=1 Tax=Staphylococcus marylandisciuri TaxID=2981529 RepID=A0ABT2QT28_9STAP|nr:ISL3 family transposase [Staphylococcus marylandisciuri]MCU5747139.1 ISL3 family transposase [Staphylococcus marylandisciuri]
MFNIILTTLGIKDKNILLEEKVEEKQYKGVVALFYFGKLTYHPERCQLCGLDNMNNSIIKNGFKKSCLTIPRVSEKAAYLVLRKQRYYCKKCCSYFTAETSLVERHCFISWNTRLAVLNKAVDLRSQKSIGQSCHVSCSTVSRIMNQAASQVAQTPFKYLPEHLMMDEFKSVKNIDGKMSFIYADAITHRIVDIVPDRRLFALKNYFYRFPLAERKRVKTVSIDMYEPYMVLIKEVFPNAEIIIDRFHIVQALNRALNMTRVSVMNRFKNAQRPLYNKFKRYWKMLLKPQEQLEGFTYRRFRLYKQWKTQKGIVKHLLGFDKKLLNTYDLVNKLRYALRENDQTAFELALKNIEITRISPQLQTVVKTLKKYTSMIDNTMVYRNLTNGPLEGINTKIKLIQRVSFGYRNFDHLRSRIILCTNLFVAHPKKEIKQHKTA